MCQHSRRGTDTVSVMLLRRNLTSSPWYECTSCCQQGHASSKTLLEQNPPVLLTCIMGVKWLCLCIYVSILPSVLWHCWLGVRKSIRPVKKWVMRCWHDCLEWGSDDLHMVQLMPLRPHHLLLHWNLDCFNLYGVSLRRFSWRRGC